MTDPTMITDFSKLMTFLLSGISAGFAVVIWWVIRGIASDVKKVQSDLTGSIADIRAELTNRVSMCGERFRTKKEAETQWASLQSSLQNMENLAKERHEQVWKKIDNQTALFMQEKSLLTDAIQKNTDRITVLEVKRGTRDD